MKTLIVICAACGVGKTTIKGELKNRDTLVNFAYIDTDEVGINWWDYEGTENEGKFSDDCLAKAVQMSGDKHLIFSTCMNPFDFYGKVTIPEGISETYFVGMACSDDEIAKRLKARPEERMCGDNEFINGQIQYNSWFKKNRGKFQCFVDTTDITIEQAANTIEEFAKTICQ